MPLAKVQLMESPGGPGVTGAVKAGSGINISADGTISATGGGGGITGVTTSAPLSGGGSTGSVSLSFDTGTTSLTKYLQLTGGTLTGNTSLVNATGKFSITSSTGPGANNAPLMVSTARQDWSWIGYFYNTSSNEGVTLRSFNTGGSIDSSVSNQITGASNFWFYSSAQARMTGNVSGAQAILRVALNGPPNYKASLSQTGTWGVGVAEPTEVLQNFSSGLQNILGLEPVIFQPVTYPEENPTPGIPNDTWVTSTTPTLVNPGSGFTLENLQQAFPEAIVEPEEPGEPYFFDTVAILCGVVNSIQTLNANNLALQSQLETLRSEFEAYVAANP
jgi:hypothetical protein